MAGWNGWQVSEKGTNFCSERFQIHNIHYTPDLSGSLSTHRRRGRRCFDRMLFRLLITVITGSNSITHFHRSSSSSSGTPGKVDRSIDWGKHLPAWLPFLVEPPSFFCCCCCFQKESFGHPLRTPKNSTCFPSQSTTTGKSQQPLQNTAGTCLFTLLASISLLEVLPGFCS